jgi:iron complex outermembrane receptor protein
MRKFTATTQVCICNALFLAGYASPALAQTAPSTAPATPAAEPAPTAAPTGDIVVTGTRTSGFKVSDSPAPIQLLGSDTLKRTGQQDLVSALAQNLPSIQAQAFGSDQAALHPMFRLRGLSPNDTLILVNGKRRHGNANVVVSGGPFSGGASADISLIPTASIDHVEVLQDGAAAQYGTDAIAGVINIIQKHNDHGGSLSGTIGQYMDGGGRSYDIQGNIGLAPIENSWINIAAERKHSGLSFRGDFDARVFGTPAGAALVAKYPGTLSADNYPYVNRFAGDPKIDLTTVTYNAGVDLANGMTLYSFGSYGHRNAVAIENYRGPNAVTGVNPNDIPYPQGFSPKESTRETDYAASLGLRGTLAGVGFDLSSTYGRDDNDLYVIDGSNGSLYFDTSTATRNGFSPRTFYDGTLRATQWTNNLDLTREIDAGLAAPVTIAAGLEYRRETYTTLAGEPSSYYGNGASGLVGHTPADAGSFARSDFSQYLDISTKPLKDWLINASVRHEHYSDFGATTVFKVTSRYDISDALAVRGTVSTGFRAPTLAEEHYSGITVGPSRIIGVLAPNSPGAIVLGISGLKPEKSTNLSAGLVLKPVSHLTLTVDGFFIKLNKRIVQSGSFSGYNGNPFFPRSPAVLAALAANGVNVDPAILTSPVGSVAVQSFVNGADTRTAGVDVSATYSSRLGRFGTVDWSLAGNYTDSKITKVYAPPSNVNQSVALLDPTAISNLVAASPKWRIVGGINWSIGHLNVNVRESVYGPSYVFIQDAVLPQYDKIESRTAGITDIEVGYHLTRNLTIAAGANNLFNKYPTKQADIYRKGLLQAGSVLYASSVYPSFSPYGMNGGYYYGRVSLSW